MISSDLPEALGLTDRLLVIHEAGLAATLPTAETTPDKVLNKATRLGISIKGDTPMSGQN